VNSSSPDALAFEHLLREHYASIARYVARRLPRESLDDAVAATLPLDVRAPYGTIEVVNGSGVRPGAQPTP